MSNTLKPLHDRSIVLVVGGGIAAYKSVILARELQRAGATVHTVLTEAAQHFVGPVTFAGVTGQKVHTNLWDPDFAGELHIELTRSADAVVIAPATADLLARAALGIANDLATTVLAAAPERRVFAPAMHPRMWNNPANLQNVATLVSRGASVFGPVDGPLASGESGIGRMAEPEQIVDAVQALFVQDLKGTRILISAGPTYEPLDPVRFIGNRSSGKMGFALAARARDRGALVTLVTGPVTIQPPAGVELIRVRTALEMQAAMHTRAEANDAIIMSAAVADYRPMEVAKDKIKKGSDDLVIHLVKNPDILSELGAKRGTSRRPMLIGFAVESRELIQYARGKLERKGCDLVVANLAEHGFEGDDNVAVLVSRTAAREMGRLSKHALADAILDEVRAFNADG